MLMRALGLLVFLLPLACSSEDGGGSSSVGGGAGGGGSAGKGGQGATGGTSNAGSGGSAGTGGASGSAGTAAAAGTGGAMPVVPDSPPLCAIDVTCDDPIEDDVKVLCQFRLTYGDGVVGYDDHAGVELRGRSSQDFPKLNYSVELRTAADVDAPASFFGMGSDADWVLDGAWADRSLFRNDLVFDLFRSLGPDHYAAECNYCTLTLNAEEQGIYRLCEKVKRDDDRVTIAVDDGTGQSFVIKQDDEGSLSFDVGLQDTWKLVSPSEENATPAQVDGVQAWLDAFDTSLSSQNRNDPENGVAAFLDVPSTVDFILLEEFSKNIDAYNLSLHLTKDIGGKARFVPWDFDLSFGQPTLQGDDNESPEGWVRNRTRIINALTGTTAIASQLGPRWRELRAGPLSEAAITAWIDSYLVTLTAPAIAANFDIWPIEEVDFSIAYEPYTQYPVTSHADEVQKMRAWIRSRLAWVDANIDQYPD